MPKNLIVCSDGTGNKGGSTPSSNVYKVYKAINKHYQSKADKDTQIDTQIDEQIVFYDNGVGTAAIPFLGKNVTLSRLFQLLISLR